MDNFSESFGNLKEEISELIKKEKYNEILNRLDLFERKKNNNSTERKSAKEIFKEKLNFGFEEKMFKSLLNLSNTGIFILSLYKYLYVNKVWHNIVGYSEKEAYKLDPIEIIHPDMKEQFRQKTNARFNGENIPERLEVKIISKDNKTKWLDITCTLIQYEGQKALLGFLNDITENRNTRDALKKSEEKYRQLTELSPSAICIQTKERFLWVNPAWVEITGYSNEEVLDLQPLDIVHPDMKEIARERSSARLNNQEAVSRYYLKILTKDNTVKWIDMAITIIEIDGQKVSMAVSSDITRRVNAQEALKNSESKYRSLIENLKNEYILFRYDVNAKFEYVSPSIKNILGYSQEEFLAYYTKYLNVNPINIKSRLSISGVQQEPYEIEIYDSNSKIHILKVSESPVFDINNKVIAVEGIVNDITKQKENERIINEQLKAIQGQNEEIRSVNEEINAVNEDLETKINKINKLNEELNYRKNRYKRLVRNIPGAVFRCLNDRTNIMEYMSDGIEALTGYPASDFVNNNVRTFISIVHPEDSERIIKTIKNGINEFKLYSIEYRLLHADGRIVWVYERGQQIIKEKEEILYLNGVILDISDKKKVEEDLIESENQLRILNAQKDKFFSLIAHDLRSPIGNFLQISELLKMKHDQMPIDQVNILFDDMHVLADKTYTLLENLLMWSRSQLGRLDSKNEELNLYKTIEDIGQLFSENLKAKLITLDIEIPDDFVINADFNLVQTVFRNLINNAIKFSYPGGSIKVNYKVELIDNIEFVILSVKDTGIGMPEKVINTLFNIDSDYSNIGTANEKGTGLGLLLCKELIEKDGGKIWVGSEEGKGSLFCFTLKR